MTTRQRSRMLGACRGKRSVLLADLMANARNLPGGKSHSYPKSQRQAQSSGECHARHQVIASVRALRPATVAASIAYLVALVPAVALLSLLVVALSLGLPLLSKTMHNGSTPGLEGTPPCLPSPQVVCTLDAPLSPWAAPSLDPGSCGKWSAFTESSPRPVLQAHGLPTVLLGNFTPTCAGSAPWWHSFHAAPSAKAAREPPSAVPPCGPPLGFLQPLNRSGLPPSRPVAAPAPRSAVGLALGNPVPSWNVSALYMLFLAAVLYYRDRPPSRPFLWRHFWATAGALIRAVISGPRAPLLILLFLALAPVGVTGAGHYHLLPGPNQGNSCFISTGALLLATLPMLAESIAYSLDLFEKASPSARVGLKERQAVARDIEAAVRIISEYNCTSRPTPNQTATAGAAYDKLRSADFIKTVVSADVAEASHRRRWFNPKGQQCAEAFYSNVLQLLHELEVALRRSAASAGPIPRGGSLIAERYGTTCVEWKYSACKCKSMASKSSYAYTGNKLIYDSLNFVVKSVTSIEWLVVAPAGEWASRGDLSAVLQDAGVLELPSSADAEVCETCKTGRRYAESVARQAGTLGMAVSAGRSHGKDGWSKPDRSRVPVPLRLQSSQDAFSMNRMELSAVGTHDGSRSRGHWNATLMCHGDDAVRHAAQEVCDVKHKDGAMPSLLSLDQFSAVAPQAAIFVYCRPRPGSASAGGPADGVLRAHAERPVTDLFSEAGVLRLPADQKDNAELKARATACFNRLVELQRGKLGADQLKAELRDKLPASDAAPAGAAAASSAAAGIPAKSAESASGGAAGLAAAGATGPADQQPAASSSQGQEGPSVQAGQSGQSGSAGSAGGGPPRTRSGTASLGATHLGSQPRHGPKPAQPRPPRPAQWKAAVQRILAATNHYEVLGLGQSAIAGDIKRAFHTAALAVHPDKVALADRAAVTPAFQRLNSAHEVLKAPASRAQYDASLQRPARGAKQGGARQSPAGPPQDGESRGQSAQRPTASAPRRQAASDAWQSGGKGRHRATPGAAVPPTARARRPQPEPAPYPEPPLPPKRNPSRASGAASRGVNAAHSPARGQPAPARPPPPPGQQWRGWSVGAEESDTANSPPDSPTGQAGDGHGEQPAGPARSGASPLPGGWTVGAEPDGQPDGSPPAKAGPSPAGNRSPPVPTPPPSPNAPEPSPGALGSPPPGTGDRAAGTTDAEGSPTSDDASPQRAKRGGGRAKRRTAGGKAQKPGPPRSVNPNFLAVPRKSPPPIVQCPVSGCSHGCKLADLVKHLAYSTQRGWSETHPRLDVEQLRACHLAICNLCSRAENRTVYFSSRECKMCVKRHNAEKNRAADAELGEQPLSGSSGSSGDGSSGPGGKGSGGSGGASSGGGRGGRAGNPFSAEQSAAILLQLPPNASNDEIDACLINLILHETECAIARRAKRAAGQAGKPPEADHSSHFYTNLRKVLELASVGLIGKAAAQLSRSGVCSLTEDVQRQLDALHPRAHPGKGRDTYATLQLSEEEVKEVVPRLDVKDLIELLISKAREKIAPGISGITYGRLRDIVACSADAGSKLTVMLQHLADGNASHKLCTLINLCAGIAFDKGNGGVRPIAMGETLLKCAQLLTFRAAGLTPVVRDALGPHSFTFATPGGSTTYAWAVTGALGRENTVLLQADVGNAFNTLSRKRLFEVLADKPELKAIWPLVTLMYGRANSVLFRSNDGSAHEISAQEGVRQGDPLATILHDLCYRPVLDHIETLYPGVIVLNYADDPSFVAPAASPEQAAALVGAYKLFREKLWESNSQRVREDKVKLYVPHGTGVDADSLASQLGVPPDSVSREGAIVGGIAVGSAEFKASHADSVVGKLLGKLRDIITAKQEKRSPHSNSMQACAALIRAVILPAFTHIIRGHDPSAIKDVCHKIDEAAYANFLRLCNIRGEAGTPLADVSRTRFFLPLALGGFGMMSMEATADAAYVAAWACSAGIINAALGLSSDAADDFLQRNNFDARSEAGKAGPRGLYPRRPAVFDDFDVGQGAPVPGGYRAASDLTVAEGSDPDSDFVIDIFPGLRAAWMRVRHALSLKDISSASHYLTAPRGQLQKDLSVDLGRERYDELLERVTPQQRAQLVESTGGLLRFALGAFSVHPGTRICDRAWGAAVRELLFLGPRDAVTALFVPAADGGLCRQCSKQVNCDAEARYADCGHVFRVGFTCPKLQPYRTRLSSRLQQLATDLRRGAGLLDPVVAGGPLRNIKPGKWGGKRVIDLDRFAARADGSGDKKVYCDDAWVAPNGDVIVSDTSVLCACVQPGAESGAVLRGRMAVKMAKYKQSHGIVDAAMQHLVYTVFGQVHRETAQVIKHWAREGAAAACLSPSTAITRALERLGATIFSGLGDSLAAFEFLCAPYPRARGGAGPSASPARVGPGGNGAPGVPCLPAGAVGVPLSPPPPASAGPGAGGVVGGGLQPKSLGRLSPHSPAFVPPSSPLGSIGSVAASGVVLGGVASPEGL